METELSQISQNDYCRLSIDHYPPVGEMSCVLYGLLTLMLWVRLNRF